MGKIDVAQGEVLHRQGDSVESVELLLKGSFSLQAGEDYALQADSGAILGAFTPTGETYRYTYTASEAGTLFAYDYNSEEDLISAIKETPAIEPVMGSATVALVNGLIDALDSLYEKGRGLVLDLKSNYTDYRNVCAALMTPPQTYATVEALELPERPELLSSWQVDFWQASYEQDEKLRQG